jgi:hypothetical protein
LEDGIDNKSIERALEIVRSMQINESYLTPEEMQINDTLFNVESAL